MAGSAVLVAGAIFAFSQIKNTSNLNDIVETSTPTVASTYTPRPTATYTPTSTPTPEISAEFLALRNTLDERITEYKNTQGIDTTIAVTDLQNMQTIDVGGDVPMRPGCTQNMYALLMLMDEVQNGNIDYASIQNSLAEGVAYSHPWKFAEIFFQEFGSTRIGEIKTQQWMIDHGFSGTYDHVPASDSVSGIENASTANEVNDAFVRLYRGEFFNPEITEETMNILRDGIPANLMYMLPEYISGDYLWIARKLGTFLDFDGRPEIDCGIIQPKSERTYSICVFTAGGANTLGTRGEGSFIVADLSVVVKDYFSK